MASFVNRRRGANDEVWEYHWLVAKSVASTKFGPIHEFAKIPRQLCVILTAKALNEKQLDSASSQR